MITPHQKLWITHSHICPTIMRLQINLLIVSKHYCVPFLVLEFVLCHTEVGYVDVLDFEEALLWSSIHWFATALVVEKQSWRFVVLQHHPVPLALCVQLTENHVRQHLTTVSRLLLTLAAIFRKKIHPLLVQLSVLY